MPPTAAARDAALREDAYMDLALRRALRLATPSLKRMLDRILREHRSGSDISARNIVGRMLNVGKIAEQIAVETAEAARLHAVTIALASRVPAAARAYAQLNGKLPPEREVAVRQRAAKYVADETERLIRLLAADMDVRVALRFLLSPREREMRAFIRSRGFDPADPWHIRTIFNAIVTAEYHREMIATTTDPAVIDLLYAYEFVTQRDDRVRETHAALDAKMIPVDLITREAYSPLIPPLGWNCRCMIFPRYEPVLTDRIIILPAPFDPYDA